MFHLTQYTDIGLLLLRVMVGVVFFASGWNTLKDPDARAKGIEMSRSFAVFLGLMLISLGAIWKKIVAWHIDFWGNNAAGWHYDLMLLPMNVVVVTTDGGRYVRMA